MPISIENRAKILKYINNIFPLIKFKNYTNRDWYKRRN